MESILDSIPDMILVVDSENTIIKSNDSARKALGLAKDDISGMHLNAVADIDMGKASHGSVPGTIKSVSGQIPTVFWAKRITDMQGEQCTIIVAKDDSGMATELKKKIDDLNSSYSQLFGYKEMMEESYEEFKKVSKKKDEFVSMVAHELKTPLAAIHGFSELLKNEKVFSDPKTREKYLGITIRETERLNRLVSQILDLSRIDLGTMNLNIERIDFSEILKIADENIRQRAEAKGLSLEFQIDRSIFIESDKERLIQIVLNLVDNAVKYTEHGSILVSAKADGTDIMFSVSDTGVGIPEEHFNKIFTRFYEVDSSFSRKVGGTGLGLSIVKEIVELFSGKIWFESKYGKGTTFFLRLPVKYRRPDEKITGN
ncbi:MAG: PAS domain S-box protein [Candidatus Aenigmarchaeota archaeon]|nr:PAS domain S-box protein [Candidatus Aenigmarchaeota archaeon]